ncbi:MAG: arabinan endo-1,5-alpha-L-arabinosidase [Ardenticatenaceae bacterium]|nr:arabinan endo-1,5-alpha-L-arabinosidase [Ardenticatenaceae bacterium]MCB8986703.1 arabinan endo-1,5-alpha-L-arabinosidase [Ardenticatenaceae bacterium]
MRPAGWFALLVFVCLFSLAACQQVAPESVPQAEYSGVVLEPEGQIQQIHDPVIAFEDGTYYVFSTGRRIPIICSPDKINWESCGRVFFRNPSWTRDINPNLADIWAPDISFFNNRWHLYYAVSNFGTQNSAIALATNTTLDPESPNYEWQDQGIVLRSQPGDKWNAIDPNLVLDEEGNPWLAWGSFWSGIWMGQIDPATGQLADDPADFQHLADRSAGPDRNPAIEAPFIVKRGDYWYLFISFDQCCQGAASTYNVRVGRSDSLTGPYMDREGVPLTAGGGTWILAEYGRWKGPGHNGLLVEDDAYWLVYHAYDSKQNGVPKLRLESLSWDAEGWPSLPSQTPEE